MLIGTMAAPVAVVVPVVLGEGVVDAGGVVEADAAGAIASESTVVSVSAVLLESELHAAKTTTAESDNTIGDVLKQFIEITPV